MSGAIPAAYSQGKGKTKGKQNIGAKEQDGREAGELPFGLDQYTDKKGELPSGLQKKQNEEGSLTRRLEEGGNELKTTAEANTASKNKNLAVALAADLLNRLQTSDAARSLER